MTTIDIPADKPQTQRIKAVEEAPDARAMLIQHPKAPPQDGGSGVANRFAV